MVPLGNYTHKAVVHINKRANSAVHTRTYSSDRAHQITMTTVSEDWDNLITKIILNRSKTIIDLI